jgi:hypothetical protein
MITINRVIKDINSIIEKSNNKIYYSNNFEDVINSTVINTPHFSFQIDEQSNDEFTSVMNFKFFIFDVIKLDESDKFEKLNDLQILFNLIVNRISSFDYIYKVDNFVMNIFEDKFSEKVSGYETNIRLTIKRDIDVCD